MAYALLVALLLACGPAPARAEYKGSLAAKEMNGYARLIFTFDKTARAQVKTGNGVLLISFDDLVTVNISKLADDLPNYISVARRDPDGKILRIALKQSARANLLDAGEKLFLDLLPDSWTGLPPGLPQDVVEQLAKRARLAEEALKALTQEREKNDVKKLTAKVATAPSFTRITFGIPEKIAVGMERAGEQVKLSISAPVSFDIATLKTDMPPYVKGLEQSISEGTTQLSFTVPADIDLNGFREDEDYIINITNPKPERVMADVKTPKTGPAQAKQPAPPKQPAAGKEPPAQPLPPSPAGQAKAPPAKPAEPPKPAEPGKPAGDAAVSAMIAGVPEVPALAVPPPEKTVVPLADLKPVKPAFEKVGDSLRIQFPFGETVPAAAFQRAGTAWLVFENRQPIEPVELPKIGEDIAAGIATERVGGVTIYRLPLKKPNVLNLALKDKTWIATIGDNGVAPARMLSLARDVSEEGRTILTGSLPRAGSVQWLTDPDSGERLIVVPGAGPVYGLPKPQKFVELQALQTSHGFLFLPIAEDIQVRSGLDDVRIGRDKGLTLTLGADTRRNRTAAQNAPKQAFVDADTWRADAKGNVRNRMFMLVRDAADVPKRDRTEARLRLANMYLANGYHTEARMVMRAVMSEDEFAAMNKQALMTSAIADILDRRYASATKTLALPLLSLEPEAAFWKAVIEARNQRWPQALAGLRLNLDVLDRYPERLNGILRPLVIETAIASNELSFATQQLDAYEHLEGPDRDVPLALWMRGRISEQMGRTEDALANFDAAVSGTRPVEARARLGRAILRHQNGTISRAQAIAELETVGAMWRRDEVELRALAKLGELYAEEGRWRDAFAAARRALEIMPDHELTRGLQDEMAKRFDQLFIEGKDEGLSKVEALGLYYDFKMFTPPGRRGDEMIRNLADRLASLDLLDQASELLQHQVDKRISGAARAQVAARLAVIYLQNRKPMEAIEVLRLSRMSELPPELRRARLLLEARALSEISRTDLAIEILSGQTGEDAMRLRADVYWRGKRWLESGEAYEQMLGDRWQNPAPLSPIERSDILRAGISYALAEDALGSDRLRSKYAGLMADSVDGRSFALVSGDMSSRVGEFRELARSVVSAETLSEFLNAYRKRYPDIAGTGSKPEPAKGEPGKSDPPLPEAPKPAAKPGTTSEAPNKPADAHANAGEGKPAEKPGEHS